MSLKLSDWIDICYYLNKIFKNPNKVSSYEIYQAIFSYLLRDDSSLNKHLMIYGKLEQTIAIFILH